MTIDEAIKVLETFHDQSACTLDATSANAFQLGIEALKALAEQPAEGYTCIRRPLPGETKE